MSVKPTRSPALEYAELCLAVFPCHAITKQARCTCGKVTCPSPGKHPRVKNWQKEATTDPEKIAQWSRKYRGPVNVGIATGAPSGVWVLDVDGAKGMESLAEIEAKHGKLPATWVAETGGGGLHLYFRGGAELRNSQGKVAPGIDVRATGGYVIAPPSNHHSGGVYRWLNGIAPWES